MDSTFILGDIIERNPAQLSPQDVAVFAPDSAAASGFPKPRTRWRRQQTAEAPSADGSAISDADITSTPVAAPVGDGSELRGSLDARDWRNIDRENEKIIKDMSPDALTRAQSDFFSGLSPELIQKLLRRANIDQVRRPSPSSVAKPPVNQPGQISIDETSVSSPSETTAPISIPPSDDQSRGRAADQDTSPQRVLTGPFSSSIDLNTQSTDHTFRAHFPAAPRVPDLHPADPDFLKSLHDKFFPNLPSDPEKLAWMAPLPAPDSAEDRASPYHPGRASVSPVALRFDFHGTLIPPRTARAIPVSRGLHHHANAPEAAGYTVIELARLARSAVPAQRCIAFQTLGRVLYRLGRGEWGSREDSDGLATGIWACMRDGRVLDSLGEAAAVPEGSGHRGSRAYAIEALWLFEKGGWRVS